MNFSNEEWRAIFIPLICKRLNASMQDLVPFSAGVALMIVLQGLFTYAPAMNEWFRTTPIDLAAWGRITAVGLAIYVTIGVEKWLKYRQR